MHIEQAQGRRTYDAGVNIVPYIDMLMTLMIFLMVTAVWTNTRTLEASSSTGACERDCGDPVPPVPVQITSASFVVDGVAAADVKAAAEVARRIGIEQRPGAVVDISVDDGVPLARVTEFMDAAVGAGLKAQSLHGVTR